jgi:hypothetical protein
VREKRLEGFTRTGSSETTPMLKLVGENGEGNLAKS